MVTLTGSLSLEDGAGPGGLSQMCSGKSPVKGQIMLHLYTGPDKMCKMGIN